MGSDIQFSPEHSLHMEMTREINVDGQEKGAYMEIHGSRGRLVETLEQVAWLAAISRIPIADQLTVSKVDFRVLEPLDENNWLTCELTLVKPENEIRTEDGLGKCWADMLHTGIMAYGFPIVERPEDLWGLEIPFDIMCALAGVRQALNFEKGVILKGPEATLFPVIGFSKNGIVHKGPETTSSSVVSESDCIQWHYVKGEGNARLLEKLKSYSNWFQCMDLKYFRNCRTFLGYCSHSRIYLGGQSPDIKESLVPRERSWTEMDRDFSGNVNIGTAIGPVRGTIGATPKFSLPKSLWKPRAAKEPVDRTRLRNAKKSPLLLYDAGTSTGWLVPEITLLLHIIHSYILTSGASRRSLKALSSAGFSASTSEVALAAVEKCNDLELWKSEDGKPYRFSDVVRRYLDAFDGRKEERRLKMDALQLRARSGLRGWDYVELRDEEAFHSRELEVRLGVSRPSWWEFGVDFRTLVVFGREVGQPIRPDREKTKVCSFWTAVPPNKNLLVADVACLEVLITRNPTKSKTKKLAPNLKWHRPKGSRLFEECTSSCNPVQEVHKRDAYHKLKGPIGPLQSPGRLEPNGAVIFGWPKDVNRDGLVPCRALDIVEPRAYFQIAMKKPAIVIFSIVVLLLGNLFLSGI